jgi:hypothetical protein
MLLARHGSSVRWQRRRKAPLDPNEMALIDAACVVYRASDRPYRHMPERLWAPSLRYPMAGGHSSHLPIAALGHKRARIGVGFLVDGPMQAVEALLSEVGLKVAA